MQAETAWEHLRFQSELQPNAGAQCATHLKMGLIKLAGCAGYLVDLRIFINCLYEKGKNSRIRITCYNQSYT